MSKKKRIIKLRYVPKEDEDSTEILEVIARQFPKANLDINIDRVVEYNESERDQKLEAKAIEVGNKAIDKKNAVEKENKEEGREPLSFNLRKFIVKLTEGGSIAAFAEVVKTFITKIP